MSPNELAAVLSAIGAILGGLGTFGWVRGRRGAARAEPLNRDDLRALQGEVERLRGLVEVLPTDVDRAHQDTRGEVRHVHTEMRVSSKDIARTLGEMHRTLVRVEAQIDAKL